MDNSGRNVEAVAFGKVDHFAAADEADAAAGAVQDLVVGVGMVTVAVAGAVGPPGG
jgi:hypothetical protein